MHLSPKPILVLALLTSACPGGQGESTSQASETSEGSTGTTGTTADASTSTGTPTSGTTDAPTSTDASTTTGLVCDPQGLPACPVTGCREDWSFECPGCGDFLGGTCFEIDVGCAYPALNCDLPSPCDRVWGQGYDTIDALEDDAAAICLLTALRDGTPGRFELLYGEMGDQALVYMTVYSGGGPGVLVEYFLECQGCPDSGYFGRTGTLELQPDTYFDDCLAMPTPASLIDCAFGFTTFTAGDPPPADYAPPWTTGACLDLDIACP